MRATVLTAGLTAFLIALLGGCSTQTEIVKLYEDDDSSREKYERLLVIDVSGDLNRRQLFEDEIVRILQTDNTYAVSSHTEIASSDGVSQGTIHALSDKLKADGILITHFVSVDTTPEIKEGREDVVSVSRQGDPLDHFLYDHEVLIEPDSAKVAHTVAVVARLYDAKSRQRIWEIQSTCFKKSSMLEVLREEASAIVNKLRSDGYIESSR